MNANQLDEIRARVQRVGLEPGRRWAVASLEHAILDRAALLDYVDALRSVVVAISDYNKRAEVERVPGD